nr:hypothetical protein [uncultured Ralstonia sp.]
MMDLLYVTPFLAILIAIGKAIAAAVSNSDNPYIASVMWPFCGAAVPAIWFYSANARTFLDFSFLWPLVYVAFFLPTAGSAIVFSWLGRHTRKNRG